ncbi:uncharacterized protein BcabD6B2_43950 [Babesia caballi]|uniref:Uncharacterized protein n=1 Tax=Babesia caballi TaxID=5871 RepID=A0AAV4LYF7_BABCB|nr:hypothetical protein BcabD6B2_43950 [Babesia caballi]
MPGRGQGAAAVQPLPAVYHLPRPARAARVQRREPACSLHDGGARAVVRLPCGPGGELGGLPSAVPVRAGGRDAQLRGAAQAGEYGVLGHVAEPGVGLGLAGGEGGAVVVRGERRGVDGGGHGAVGEDLAHDELLALAGRALVASADVAVVAREVAALRAEEGALVAGVLDGDEAELAHVLAHEVGIAAAAALVEDAAVGGVGGVEGVVGELLEGGVELGGAILDALEGDDEPRLEHVPCGDGVAAAAELLVDDGNGDFAVPLEGLGHLVLEGQRVFVSAVAGVFALLGG